MGRTVRVVLETFNLGGNAVFAADEVDNAVMMLVPATAVPHGNSTRVIPATILGAPF
jgi:hypothetical protein